MIKVSSCFPLSFSYLFPYICSNRKNITQIKHQVSVLCSFVVRGESFPTFLSPTRQCLRFHSDSKQEPTLQSLFCATTSCSSINLCRTIHARVVKILSYSDGFIGDRLVYVYAKLGFVDDAQILFDEMPHKDLVSWNSLISAFGRRENLGKCLNAFYRMRFEACLEPNEVTLISMVSTCTDNGALDEGNYVHGIAVKAGLLFETKLVNSLVNMYGKFGYLDLASRLFEAMMQPNLVSWNSLVTIYIQNGLPEQAIGLFGTMRKASVKPDQATMVVLLQGCGDIGVAKLAEAIHGYIIGSGHCTDISVSTALLTFYAKSGRLSSSCKVFQDINNPDCISWTAMLAGYAMHGYGREAIDLFELMDIKGLKPDHVTFTHLLTACSHSGRVKEGRRYFEIMQRVYRVNPILDHYSCMVDLLARSGHLKEAYKLIMSMPMEPNSAVWGALLNACKIYGNIGLGKEVAEILFDLSPSDRRNYLMLSNMYSAAGLWKDASKTRALMKERVIVRCPGCSFIEHGNKIHSFVAGDQSHPESDRIYKKLEELTEKIQMAGFIPKTKLVLHDVGEDIKEDMINKHSEKLAIAFGLLFTEPALPLIIIKNLRICTDCHTMAKFVSLVEKRMIIIRDTKRFHHLADGLCSCGDYW